MDKVNRSAAAIDTDAFYRASCEAGFVKLDAVARNIAWASPTAWGDMEITINLSKPEKDPRAIAEAARAVVGQQASYTDPATGVARPCPLCVTQADVDCGYARPLGLDGEKWALWYSPYAYFDEHCIAMSWEHRPMHIDRETFSCLFDVVDALPRYFFGSNADLPIVGGSILGHDHFQGGRHVFPLQKAPLAERFSLPAFPDVEAGIVKWPVSVIRLVGASRAALVDAACAVLGTWCSYDDPSVGIVSGMQAGVSCGPGRTVSGTQATCDCFPAGTASDGEQGAPHPARRAVPKCHNTITPMLCMRDGAYQLDLALRCNVASAEHPLGVFHPHEDLHHIKKENVGLIEVMGRAILPPRVRAVMDERGLTRDDVGALFARVLEDVGVFKWDEAGREAFRRFVRSVG